MTLRELTPPGGPLVTLAFLPELLGRGDLQRLVLTPLAAGLPDAGPAELARTTQFPATCLEVAGDRAVLEKGLLAGKIALHVEGRPGALLLGSDRVTSSLDAFGSDLGTNLALLRRCVSSPALFVERIAGEGGAVNALAYLQETASPGHVAAARGWATTLGTQPSRIPWWRVLAQPLLLPMTLPCSTPVALADHLRQGYVAVLVDHRDEAMVGPLTLDVLFSSSHDVALPQSVRRLLTWPRVAAAILAMTLASGFVAITAYHHSLLPAPFLIALASGRGNLPFPIVVEIVLVGLIGEGFHAAALRIAGQRWGILASLGTALVTLTALAAGVLAPVPVVVGNLSDVAVHLAPNQTLARLLRLWRFLFTAAAVGLGLFGMALLFFGLMVHLAHAEPFGHPARIPLRGRSLEG
ncbi:MAG: spore germination protein [Bacillota bacterium]